MCNPDDASAPKTVPRRAALRKVKFGTTDMMVTEVCGGTMTWGSFNADESDAHAQLDKLWELGVNFLDTAELYPVAWNYGALTERWIGNWLAKRVADGTLKREDIYIATKINPSHIGAEHPERKSGSPTATTARSCTGARRNPSNAWAAATSTCTRSTGPPVTCPS